MLMLYLILIIVCLFIYYRNNDCNITKYHDIQEYEDKVYMLEKYKCKCIRNEYNYRYHYFIILIICLYIYNYI